MTDEDLEARLRRFAVAGPPVDLPARTRRRLQRRDDVRDLTIGCGLATAVVLFALLTGAPDAEPRDVRVDAALNDSARGAHVALAIDLLGGGPAAVDYVLFTMERPNADGDSTLAWPLPFPEDSAW